MITTNTSSSSASSGETLKSKSKLSTIMTALKPLDEPIAQTPIYAPLVQRDRPLFHLPKSSSQKTTIISTAAASSPSQSKSRTPRFLDNLKPLPEESEQQQQQVPTPIYDSVLRRPLFQRAKPGNEVPLNVQQSRRRQQQQQQQHRRQRKGNFSAESTVTLVEKSEGVDINVKKL